ncbi:MAG: hypothetical protein ACRDWI_03050 [Jiangellaceae bacterium]
MALRTVVELVRSVEATAAALADHAGVAMRAPPPTEIRGLGTVTPFTVTCRSR